MYYDISQVDDLYTIDDDNDLYSSQIIINYDINEKTNLHTTNSIDNLYTIVVMPE